MATDFNRYFNPLPHMSHQEFEQLVREGRLWSTRARFNQMAALMIMGQPAVGFHYPAREVYYQGYVVTSRPNDEMDAVEILARRGWNEILVWLVQDSTPLGEQPMLLFKN